VDHSAVCTKLFNLRDVLHFLVGANRIDSAEVGKARKTRAKLCAGKFGTLRA
jgi:hypothetical protein